jgi:chromosome segregation ATPase
MCQELRLLTDKVTKGEAYIRISSQSYLRADCAHTTDRKWWWQAEQAEAEAEHRLQEERATLTRFDTELCELDEVIKAKKQAAADVEVAIKKLEHDIQSLAKEKASHTTAVTNLEKQYEWIEEEQRGMKKKVNLKVMNMVDTCVLDIVLCLAITH